jgi:lactate dehydrogenase-like 2-hydroxyacid dehydrogenase
MSIEILQTGPLLKSCEAALAERYTVHKLHEQSDRDGWLRENGARIRAHAGSGVQSELMDKLPNLEIIASFGVGYDNIDIAGAKERDIRVTNTPDVLNDAVAELTIGLMISLARRIPQGDQFVRTGKWPNGNFGLFSELTGKTVGILGLGRIGIEIARRLEPFKVKIGYHTRNQRSDVNYTYYPSLKEMAEQVDTLISIVPGTAATHKIINAEILSALGPNGVFINVGRGTSVDEPALEAALRNRTIAAAGLDVFYQEPTKAEGFLDLDNASLLPHVASASVPTRDAMADLVVDNLIDWFDKKTVRTPVPETPVKR